MVSRDCFVPCPLFVSQSLKGAPVPGRALLTAHPWGFVAVDTVSWPWLSLSRSSRAPVGELDSSPLPEEQLVPQAGIPRHSQELQMCHSGLTSLQLLQGFFPG